MDKIFSVYVDKKENGVPFYVGKGLSSRIKYKKRNNLHSKIANKNPNWVREVVFNGTNEEVIREECRLIALYGRINLNTGTLANLTDGGEGSSGWKPSNETIQKNAKAISKAWNEKRQVYIDAFKLRSEKVKKSGVLKNRKITQEQIEKQKISLLKTISTQEWKEKQSLIQKKISARPEIKAAKSSTRLLWLENEENREKIKYRLRQVMGLPEQRLANSERIKEYFKKPGAKEKAALASKTSQKRAVYDANRGKRFYSSLFGYQWLK